MVLQLKQPQPQSDPAFVLGNGRSRLGLNLAHLQNYGTIYACNAIYREFSPDFLIAVDVKMVNEIVGSGYHKKHSVWTNPNKGIVNKANLNFFDPHKGWSSGPTALHFAATRGHKEIFILGFDYQGIEGKFNNVYADTFNYKKSTDSATFHGNWLSQTERTIQEFNKVKFYRIVEDTGFVPSQLGSHLTNLQHISFKDFEGKFEGSVYFDQMIQKTTI